MKNYIALVEKSKEEYWAIFPDFPGCASCGKDLEELQKNCVEALNLHIQGMKEDDEKIPEPSTLDEIKNKKEEWCNTNGVYILDIPYFGNINNKRRISIDIPDDLLFKIDKVAKNRSTFFEQAVEYYFTKI